MLDSDSENNPPPTGLFLGAGASYELGMPLVSGLTKELLADWLGPSKFRELSSGWRDQGQIIPDSVINDFETILARSDMHYESVLGYLESQMQRAQHRVPQQPQDVEEAQAYFGLYQWLVEMVYWVLYIRHNRNEQFISLGLPFFAGIAGLVALHRPLWIFSLNHDLMIECITAHYNLPLNCGLTESMTLPRRDRDGKRIGELCVDIIREGELRHSGMPFWPRGTQGINLLKLHGALDVFLINDSNDLIKLHSTDMTVHGILEDLRLANTELIYTRPGLPQPVKATNHIAYEDEHGELQILRRSLLAGAHKFENRERGLFPQLFLDTFRDQINGLSTVICIGYGFGDAHVNMVMRNWLEADAGRRLIIVRPGDQGMPQVLSHVAPQVELVASSATDYLERFAPEPLSDSDRAAKRIRLDVLARGAEQIANEVKERYMRAVQGQMDQLRWSFTIDRETGRTVADLATQATPNGVDLVSLIGRDGVIGDIERWIHTEEMSYPDGVSYGNPLLKPLYDPAHRTDLSYRQMIALAQNAVITKQLAGLRSGAVTPAEAVANVIFDGYDVEHPNPHVPDVEIATLHLTLVTQDGTRSDFSVQLGFQGPCE